MMMTLSIGSAKEWHGIVPLHSTRADVVRLLGAATDDRSATYYLPDETVVVQFSKFPCDEKTSYEKWKVAPGTVISIRVIPKKQVQLADLRLNLASFKKVRGDDDLVGHFYYVNEEEGFSIEVQSLPNEPDEIVGGYIYEPAAKDNHLRCPTAAAKNPCGSNRRN